MRLYLNLVRINILIIELEIKELGYDSSVAIKKIENIYKGKQ